MGAIISVVRVRSIRFAQCFQNRTPAKPPGTKKTTRINPSLTHPVFMSEGICRFCAYAPKPKFLCIYGAKISKVRQKGQIFEEGCVVLATGSCCRAGRTYGPSAVIFKVASVSQPCLVDGGDSPYFPNPFLLFCERPRLFADQLQNATRPIY